MSQSATKRRSLQCGNITFGSPDAACIWVIVNARKRSAKKLAAGFLIYWLDHDMLSEKQITVLQSMIDDAARLHDEGEVLE